MSIIIFIVILLVLILVHEYGHFFTSKMFGIRVEEFGIGFPPRAKTLFKKNGTLYTLNWIPFGGFVRIFGQNGVDAIEDKDSANSTADGVPFYSVAKWKQSIVLFAGVAMNFILAFVIFFFIYVSGTVTSIDENINPKYLKGEPYTVVQSLLADYPAADAGVLPGDIVAKVTYGDVVMITPTPEEIIASTVSGAENTYTIDVIRNNEYMNYEITPVSIDGSYKIGVMMAYVGEVKYPIFPAIGEAFKTSCLMFWDITKGILGIFSGSTDVKSITGPVGIVGIVGDVYKIGFAELLSFTALISLNLAVINLVPFPALDGGRLVFVAVESITRKPVPQRFFEIANTVGFFLLIGLMLLVTFRDVINLF